MKRLKTNTNVIRKKVQDHILECYENVDELIRDLDDLKKVNHDSVYHAAAHMVETGTFLYYLDDVKEFLNSLGINANNKEYSDEKSWKLYKHLIAINCKILYQDIIQQ